MRDIEVSEAVEATQLPLRDPPEAGVGQVQPCKVAEATKSSSLNSETEVRPWVWMCVDTEVGQPRQAGQTGSW